MFAKKLTPVEAKQIRKEYQKKDCEYVKESIKKDVDIALSLISENFMPREYKLSIELIDNNVSNIYTNAYLC